MAGYHLLCTGPLEVQGLSSSWVTIPVLLPVGSRLDQTIISPSGRESRNRQTGSWPLDSRQKGPFKFQIVCLCDRSPVPSTSSSPFSLSPLVLIPTHAGEQSLQRVRPLLLHEWIWGLLLGLAPA